MCDILVLEDDSLLREMVVELLAGEGWDVRGTEDVDAAYAMLREPPRCRLLIADRDLGGAPGRSDGFGFAAEAMRLNPMLSVLYVSGHHQSLRERGFSPRERALPKPFVAGEVVEIARDLLRP